MDEGDGKKTGRRKQRRETPSAYDKAVDLLARKQHTAAGLRRKLRQRGYERGEVDKALARLNELGYLNDEMTASIWAEQLSRQVNIGRRRAVEKLIVHGVPVELAKREVENIWDDELEREHASRTLEKLLQSSSTPSQGPQRNAKLYRSLVSRGFDPDVVRGLLEALRSNEGEM